MSPHRLSVGGAEGLVAVGAVVAPPARARTVDAAAAEAAGHVLAPVCNAETESTKRMI